MPGFRDLVERRVPQYFAIYLGAGWGLIEFMSFLEQRFALSPSWTNMAMLTWVLLVPSVLLYFYNHGRPGRDAFTRSEKLAIPLNVILMAVVVGSAFGGADLGATMTKVTLTDEHGNETVHHVAKDGFRKRVALYTFDGPDSDSATAWLRHGALVALATDLSQDIFIDMRLPAQFRKPLRDAGFAAGLSIPVSVKRQIAEEQHLPYFIAGQVSAGVEGITLRAQLYETATGALVKERVVTARDLYAGVDELSVLLRQDLNLPQARPQGDKDLPVASFLSENVDAFRASVEGQMLAMNDAWSEAERAFARAAQLDPTYAAAQFALYQSRAIQGNGQGALPALEQAMKHLPRLPERSTFLVKVEYFLMKQDMEKAYSVATMKTELYPDDVTGHALRAQLQIYRGDFDGAIESQRRALKLDPNQRELLIEIGKLQVQVGRFEEALKMFKEFAAQSPTDAKAHLRVARAQQLLGGIADARATVERALLVDPTATEPQVELAMIERGMGDVPAGVRRLQSALAGASSVDDSLAVYNALAAVYEFGGHMKLSLEASERAVAAAARVHLPVQVLGRQMQSLSSYVRAGRTSDAERILLGIRTRMTPPLDEMWRSGQLIMALEQRDTAALREGRDGVQRIIDRFGFQIMKPDVMRADALLLELRGDWAGALKKYEELQKLDPAAMNVRRDLARVYRHLNRFDDAQRSLDAHLRMVPASPESHLEAARIKLARGDRAGARQHLDRVAQVWANADATFVPAAELRNLRMQVD